MPHQIQAQPARKLRLLPWALAGALGFLAGETAAANWPAWRPLDGSGAAAEPEAPQRWSSSTNVRWRSPLPGPGNSSPIVWNDRVFITQAESDQMSVICFDRDKGQVRWRSSVKYAEKDPTHETNPYAAASPVTDGTRVIAWFGSAGVYCYDLDGKELWRRDLGKQNHEWGYAASPVIHGGLCFINFGPGERSFLTALDVKTGRTAWQIDIPQSHSARRLDGFAGRTNGYVGSWSTPIVISAQGREELIITVPEQVRALDPKTGKDLWFCSGLNPLVYTSPIYGDGVVVAMGGFLGTTLAVRPGGTGDVTQSHLLWRTDKTKNRLGSGVIAGGHVYILNTEGIAECLELNTGKKVWEERVRGPGAKNESWSSMVRVNDRIYIPNQSGDTIVLRASPTFEVIAVNSFDGDLLNSSPAVSDGEIFIRTHKHLWCISEKPQKTAGRELR
jgi:outer membrane protein assembly factor BamB